MSVSKTHRDPATKEPTLIPCLISLRNAVNIKLMASSSKHGEENSQTAESSFTFADLPPELRFRVYGYILPNGLWQSHWLDEVQIVRSRRICSIPPLLRTSKWILEEAMNSLLKGCKIVISQGKVVTNFPIEAIVPAYRNHCRQIVWEDKIRLDLRAKLSIDIQQPSLRVPIEFFELRRAIDKVVNWLNSSTSSMQFSQINAALMPSPGEQAAKSHWNDFAMLIGPLSRLQKPFTIAEIAQPIGQSFDRKIEQQCDRLEQVLVGKQEKTLHYQQSVLDIRLPVVRIRHIMGWSRLYELEKKYDRLQLPQWCYDDVQAGIDRFQTWCQNYNVQPPTWLHELKKVMGDDAAVVLRREAVEVFHKVLEAERAPFSFENWMAGLMTSFNPFTCQELEADGLV